MNRLIRSSSILVIAAELSGCGGGGGSDQTATPSPSSPASVPLHQAVVNLSNSGYQRSLSFSGTASSGTQTLSVSGSLQVSSSSYSVPATFNGQAALSNTTTYSGTLTGNGQSIPIVTSEQSYINSSYVLLGSQSPTSYCVVTSFTPLPATGSIGTTGTWARGTCYTNSARTTTTGSQTISFSVSAGTASTNLTFTQNIVSVDTNNRQVATEQDVFLIDTQGNISLKSVSIFGVYSGVTLNLTGQSI